MKILFVSDNPIFGMGGGCVENRKHYDALKRYCEKTGDELKVISRDENLKEKFEIEIKKNKIIDVLVRLMGHSTYLYYSWLRYKKNFFDYDPDVLYLGRTRFGFMAKSIKAKKPKCKIITNIDNVELDYIEGYFKKSKGIVNKIYKKLEGFVVKHDEEDAVKYSDKLIYLTERNVRRISELYNYNEENPLIIPICLRTEKSLEKKSDKKNVIFIGSLDYEPNVLAVNKILEFWKKKYINNREMELIIAGRNPRENLIREISRLSNVKIIPDFKSIEDIIPDNSLMLAPIEKGAGMKVKVAETLSMGLMMVASDEALIGYEEAVLDNKSKGILRANSSQEYIDGIEKYLKTSKAELECIGKQNKYIYHKYYTYSVSRKKIEILLNRLLER